jgi:hypothetical protein
MKIFHINVFKLHIVKENRQNTNNSSRLTIPKRQCKKNKEAQAWHKDTVAAWCHICRDNEIKMFIYL